MNELLLMLVGAILGIIVDIMFRQTFLRFGLRVRQIVARLTKRRDPLADKPSQFRFGNILTEQVSLYGNGLLPLNSRYLRTSLIEEYVTLPKDLDDLRSRARVELETKKKKGESDVWNGTFFSLVNFYPTRYGILEEMGLNFEFKLSDYAAFSSITSKADQPELVKDAAGNPTTIREKYFPYFDPKKPNPYLTHTFVIELAVITRDDKIILVQRGDYVSVEKNAYTIAVNEAMQFPQDIDESGKPSFLRTALRGLDEELGISSENLGGKSPKIEFLNFKVLTDISDYGLSGMIKLPINAQEVETLYHLHAKDKALETLNNLCFVDYLPDAILEFVAGHGPWSPGGLLTLYYTMVREWGYWETKLAFSRHRMPWDIVVRQTT